MNKATNPTVQQTYYWDFFGPHAEGTAKHYRAHLDGFLQKHALTGCETGAESSSAGHYAIFCRTPDVHAEVIKNALKPHRAC